MIFPTLFFALALSCLRKLATEISSLRIQTLLACSIFTVVDFSAFFVSKLAHYFAKVYKQERLIRISGKLASLGKDIAKQYYLKKSTLSKTDKALFIVLMVEKSIDLASEFFPDNSFLRQVTTYTNLVNQGYQNVVGLHVMYRYFYPVDPNKITRFYGFDINAIAAIGFVAGLLSNYMESCLRNQITRGEQISEGYSYYMARDGLSFVSGLSMVTWGVLTYNPDLEQKSKEFFKDQYESINSSTGYEKGLIIGLLIAVTTATVYVVYKYLQGETLEARITNIKMNLFRPTNTQEETIQKQRETLIKINDTLKDFPEKTQLLELRDIVTCQMLLAEQKIDETVNITTRYLEKDSNHIDMKWLRSIANLQSGNFSEAELDLNQLLVTKIEGKDNVYQPDAKQIQLQLAVCSLGQGKTTHAKEQYSTIIQEINQELTSSSLSQDKRERLNQFLVSAKHGECEARIQEGKKLFSEGRLTAALEYYHNLLKTYPDVLSLKTETLKIQCLIHFKERDYKSILKLINPE